MQLNQDRKINAFAELGKLLSDFISGKLNNTEIKASLNNKIEVASRQNPWFDKKSIIHSLTGISYMLKKAKITEWLTRYENELQKPINSKNIAVIMAGNIPLVNFHDFLCVLITGHNFIGKLSSNDSVLPIALSDLLINIEPDFKNKIHFTTGKLSDFDAVIATGSDNSSRYFEYYFGKYHHIIRKNRNSIAILDGSENKKSLEALSDDIFMYYGLGCRNVSALLVPENYSFQNFFKAIENKKEVFNFYKYRNNYDYYKAVFLVNKTPHLDNGFVLLKKDNGISSPLSVLYYQEYQTKDSINAFVRNNKDSIQCIIAPDRYNFEFESVPFGKSQFPELCNYPDGVDIVRFLLEIN